jgi:uncharacterized membrane protein YgcG
MLGQVVRRFAVRAGRGRVAAAGVGAAALLGAAGVTAGAQSTPTPTCVVGLAGTCLVNGTSSSPTPTPLCLLILCNSGTTGTGTGTPTPTPCPVANTCLPPVNPTCDVTVNPSCLLATPAPCQSSCGPSPGRSSPPGTTSPRQTSQPSSTTTFSSGLGGGFSGGGGSSGGGVVGATLAQSLNVAPVPVVQEVSPVSGLEFGHAPILWPLFGILDLLGLGAVYLLVRRLRAAEPD